MKLKRIKTPDFFSADRQARLAPVRHDDRTSHTDRVYLTLSPIGIHTHIPLVVDGTRISVGGSTRPPAQFGTFAIGQVLVNVRTAAWGETISFVVVEHCAPGSGAFRA